MKKLIAILLLCAMFTALAPLAALAQRDYIIADSDSRRLTREELWQWDYESLGYILNEVFARHGYTFISGEKYDVYFRSKSWYTPLYSANNQDCYRQLTSLEWDNEALIKQVRQEMQAAGTNNPGGMSLWNLPDDDPYYDWNNDQYPNAAQTTLRFTSVYAVPNQRFPVYSAPSYSSWRGAEGKALCSTNAPIKAAGWEGSWLLISYETTAGLGRIGYVNVSDMEVAPYVTEQLTLDHASATLAYGGANLTDDPVLVFTPACYLPQGTWVTYLATYHSPDYSGSWDYVQAQVNGQIVRGFIPCGLLEIYR